MILQRRMMSCSTPHLHIFHQNIHFALNQLEVNLSNKYQHNFPKICALQELARSENTASKIRFSNIPFRLFISETGRCALLVHQEFTTQQITFTYPNVDKYTTFGFETVWCKVKLTPKLTVAVCSFYRK